MQNTAEIDLEGKLEEFEENNKNKKFTGDFYYLLDKLNRNLIGGINSKHTDFPFRIKNELDFPVYRILYKDLCDYFGVPIPGINSIKIDAMLISTLLKNNMLEFFSCELACKLNLK